MKFLVYSCLFFSFLCGSVFLYSQEGNTLLQGQIILDVEGESPEGIEIVNTATSQKVTTDALGHFTIASQANDILQVSSVGFENRRYTVTNQNIQHQKMVIHLNEEMNTIAEVVVSSLQFTGNLAEDVKNNQSKLKSYQSQQILAKVKPTDLTTGELIPTNISQGYRSRFKRKTATQKKRIEALAYRGEFETQQQVQFYFDDDFYVHTLQIPLEEIENFIVYCFSKSNIKELAKSNKYAKVQLKLIELAPKYIAQMQNNTSLTHSTSLLNLS